MKQLIEFSLNDGTFILVEVNEEDASEKEYTGSRSGRSIEIMRRANHTFEQALDAVKPAADTILRKLRELYEQPDEIEVTFGLKISAEAGAFVAATGIDANYAVTLKWKKPETHTPSVQS